MEGGGGLQQNPFVSLGGLRLPATVPNGKPKREQDGQILAKSEPTHGGNIGSKGSKRPSRGRVDIVRETGGRGGKTVTVVAGFTGIGLPEKEELAKKMRAACGCGGTVKDGRIEIQGDQRETVARILTEAGFRPVFAGG